MNAARETIAAVATAQGRGGVGIVRVSGPRALPIAISLSGREPQPRFAHYGPFYDDQGEVIDEGLLLFFRGPNSFTGEDVVELQEAFNDLRAHEIDVLTLGQYLRPSMTHLPVEKYYTPEEFKQLEDVSKETGFLYVASGPMVRSSYKAAELFIHGLIQKGRATAHGIQTT